MDLISGVLYGTTASLMILGLLFVAVPEAGIWIVDRIADQIEKWPDRWPLALTILMAALYVLALPLVGIHHLLGRLAQPTRREIP